MAVGLRMRRGNVQKYSDMRRKKSIIGGKRHGGGHDMEESDGEIFYRVEELDRFSNSKKKGRNLRSNPKQSSSRFESREGIDSHPPRRRARIDGLSKNAENERKYLVRGRRERDKDSDFSKRSKFGNARLFSERQERDKDSDFSKKSKFGNARLFSEKPTKGMRRVVDADASKYDQTRGGYQRSKGRDMRTETSFGNIRFKRKKVDEELADSSHGDDAEEEEVKKHGVGKDAENQNSEQKSVRRPTRVMDKTGKMIRVGCKSLKSSSTETSVSKKRTKRVIKIDPYDFSNKRLDDGVPKSDIVVGKDIAPEKEVTISMNAQFRAIQPSDEILAFVQDNLLGRRRLTELKNAGYNVKLSAPLDNIPFSTRTDRERMEDNVFRNKLEFFAAAKISSSLPPPTLPEIAFAGRSNVGKSSLLNALTRQWGVVRTSDKPGLTQTINFFKLASKLCLVDLPGYGFAYAKDEVKEAWEDFVKEFVSTRAGLQRVCLLVDTQWGMKAGDFELIDLMERSKTPYQIVLTKTDLVFPINVARRAMQIQEKLEKNKSIIEPVVMVSSKSGAGIRNLRSVLTKIARFVKP